MLIHDKALCHGQGSGNPGDKAGTHPGWDTSLSPIHTHTHTH